jgi:hypothetical protein
MRLRKSAGRQRPIRQPQGEVASYVEPLASSSSTLKSGYRIFLLELRTVSSQRVGTQLALIQPFSSGALIWNRESRQGKTLGTLASRDFEYRQTVRGLPCNPDATSQLAWHSGQAVPPAAKYASGASSEVLPMVEPYPLEPANLVSGKPSPRVHPSASV